MKVNHARQRWQLTHARTRCAQPDVALLITMHGVALQHGAKESLFWGKTDGPTFEPATLPETDFSRARFPSVSVHCTLYMISPPCRHVFKESHVSATYRSLSSSFYSLPISIYSLLPWSTPKLLQESADLSLPTKPSAWGILIAGGTGADAEVLEQV